MMRILLTRSPLHNMLLRQAIEEQCADLNASIQEAPLLEQVPIADSAENLQSFLQDKMIQEVIFISPSAVDFGAEKILQHIELERVFAVGKGTANMLAAKLRKLTNVSKNKIVSNIEIVFPSSGVGAEALLNMPDMQSINGLHMLIVTGSEGKPHLEKELLHRGAHVSRWECYQRQKPPELRTQLTEIFQQPLDYVFLHSSHAARYFLEEATNNLTKKSLKDSLTAVVGAKSIAEELKQHAWSGNIEIADSPMPKDMLKTFKQSLQIN